jgi:hypothetical protein
MRDSNVVIIISRYAYLDFSEIYGFPNPLPKDEYVLRNGPKFSGEDFHDFTDLLIIKNEDVFIRLFYDSFQGKCRSWDKVFSSRSIKSFSSFWLIFMETWMEKT